MKAFIIIALSMYNKPFTVSLFLICSSIYSLLAFFQLRKPVKRQLTKRKHSSRMRSDRAVTRTSNDRVAMRPIVDRMTDACENITLPCGR